MKKLLIITLLFAFGCEKKTVVVPVQLTLNGTQWKKYELRQGDRDVYKILTFKAPDIVNISVRDDHGYVFAEFQKEYLYMYEHPNFKLFGPGYGYLDGRLMDETTMEFNGEIFLKVK